mmetsp:Transcript_43169/g.108142  ORF Transcript_43169/g.108142 Transcript_43169/m.108142 type:complete len:340 (+) Transcript_43169:941-1960(+)
MGGVLRGRGLVHALGGDRREGLSAQLLHAQLLQRQQLAQRAAQVARRAGPAVRRAVVGGGAQPAGARLEQSVREELRREQLHLLAGAVCSCARPVALLPRQGHHGGAHPGPAGQAGAAGRHRPRDRGLQRRRAVRALARASLAGGAEGPCSGTGPPRRGRHPCGGARGLRLLPSPGAQSPRAGRLRLCGAHGVVVPSPEQQRGGEPRVRRGAGPLRRVPVPVCAARAALLTGAHLQPAERGGPVAAGVGRAQLDRGFAAGPNAHGAPVAGAGGQPRAGRARAARPFCGRLPAPLPLLHRPAHPRRQPGAGVCALLHQSGRGGIRRGHGAPDVVGASPCL